MSNLKYKITECNTEMESCHEVYASISKDTTKTIFDTYGKVPEFQGRPDNSYIEGELQFVFGKDELCLEDILAFPVYKESEGSDATCVGDDFVNIICDYEDDIMEVIKYLKGNLMRNKM